MYEEGNKHLSFNWKSLVIKLVILVVIIFLAGWIIIKVTGKSNNNSNNTLAASDKDYITNISSMKTAAFEYYTTSKLPTKVGETDKLTLTQMLNQKLLIDFTEDGKTCDTDASYIQVTKTADGNYALKVSLTCGKKSDFIVTTIENKNITSNGNIDPTTVPSNNTSTNTNKTNTSSTNKGSSSSSSSSSKTTTTTVKTTVNVKFNCSTSCCSTNCTIGGDKTDTPAKVREYKYKKYSDWSYGYSYNENAENKKKKVTTYNYCLETTKTYRSTGYVTEGTNPHTYTYELQFLDIDPYRVNDSTIGVINSSKSYYGSSLADYRAYMADKKKSNYLYMTGNTGKYDVRIPDEYIYRNSSLKSNNFTFNVSGIRLVNGVYRATVTVNFKNYYGVTPYYSSNLGKNVYFVPLKFDVSYADRYNCVRDLESNKWNYSNHYMTDPYTTTEWMHRTVEYKWSTSTKLSGWEYTGEYRDK